MAGLGALAGGASSDELPAGYAYELVSPDTAGQRAGLFVPPDGEDQAMLVSPGGFPGTANLPKLGAWALASRTATGWSSVALDPPANEFPYLGLGGMVDVSRDLRRTLWNVSLKGDRGTTRFTPLVREPDGSFAIAGPPLDDGTEAGPIVGTSGNLDTIVTSSTTRPPLTDGTADTRTSLQPSLLVYRRDSVGNLNVRQVAYRGNATMSPTCGVQLGGFAASARGSVSEDGSKIFFTTSGVLSSCASGAARRLWAKIGNADAVDLAVSQCTTDCGVPQRVIFEGASRDGSRVFFSTAEKLLDGDQDTTDKVDLYEYDFNATGNKLRSVTSSTAPAGAGVMRLVRLSEDGSHAYFVASGRPLTGPNGRGKTPQTGAQNLYVYHRDAGQAGGTFKFVAPLDPADVNLWSVDQARPVQVSTTGRFAIFLSAGDLTEERLPGDTHKDIFRYDAQTDELDRIWTGDPAHNGAARTAEPTLQRSPGDALQGGLQKNWDKVRFISDDGSKVLFDTPEPLSANDTNDQPDVYLWQDNDRITMLSDGEALQPAVAAGLSRSGDSIFLASSSALVKAHTSGAVAAYVLRKGGGFLDPPLPPVPCSGDGCQGSSGPVAGPLALTGSSELVGGGNLVAPAASPTAGMVRVSPVETVRGSSTKLTVRTPAKGRIIVSGTGVSGASKAASKAGSYRVTVKLSARSRAMLNRKHRLKVRVSVRFTPSTGRSSTVRVPVTFTAKKPKASWRDAQALSSDARKGR